MLPLVYRPPKKRNKVAEFLQGVHTFSGGLAEGIRKRQLTDDKEERAAAKERLAREKEERIRRQQQLSNQLAERKFSFEKDKFNYDLLEDERTSAEKARLKKSKLLIQKVIGRNLLKVDDKTGLLTMVNNRKDYLKASFFDFHRGVTTGAIDPGQVDEFYKNQALVADRYLPKTSLTYREDSNGRTYSVDSEGKIKYLPLDPKKLNIENLPKYADALDKLIQTEQLNLAKKATKQAKELGIDPQEALERLMNDPTQRPAFRVYKKTFALPEEQREFAQDHVKNLFKDASWASFIKGKGEPKLQALVLTDEGKIKLLDPMTEDEYRAKKELNPGLRLMNDVDKTNYKRQNLAWSDKEIEDRGDKFLNRPSQKHYATANEFMGYVNKLYDDWVKDESEGKDKIRTTLSLAISNTLYRAFLDPNSTVRHFESIAAEESAPIINRFTQSLQRIQSGGTFDSEMINVLVNDLQTMHRVLETHARNDTLSWIGRQRGYEDRRVRDWNDLSPDIKRVLGGINGYSYNLLARGDYRSTHRTQLKERLTKEQNFQKKFGLTLKDAEPDPLKEFFGLGTNDLPDLILKPKLP